jgi:hypothetical protein
MICGLAFQAHYNFLEGGPPMVLVLVAQFAIAYGWSLVRTRGRRRA